MSYPLINGAVINGDATSGTTTQGVMETRYGKPIFLIAPGANQLLEVPSFGENTRFGAVNVLVIADALVHPASAVRATRIGVPAWRQVSVVPGVAAIVVAPLGRVTRCGVPSVLSEYMVAAISIAPAAEFGSPRSGGVMRAQGFCITSYGKSAVRDVVGVHGFRSTAYGASRAAAAVYAGSLPSLRYGIPRIKGYALIGTLGFTNVVCGTPSIHRAARMLPAAPGVRYGRPAILRNLQC